MGKGTWVLYQRPGFTAVIPLCRLALQGLWQVPGPLHLVGGCVPSSRSGLTCDPEIRVWAEQEDLDPCQRWQA